MKGLNVLIFAACIGMLLMYSIANGELSAEDHQPKSAWEALGIENYYLRVSDITPSGGQDVQIWVSETSVTQMLATCIPGLITAECRLETVAVSRYRVEELFVLIEQLGALVAEVAYDPNYHFPTQITIDDTAAADDSRVLQVTAFEVLSDEWVMFNGDAMATATISASLTTTPALPTSTTTTLLPSVTPPPPGATAITLPPLEPRGDLSAWLESGAVRWEELGVTGYWLSVTERNPWNGIDLTVTANGGSAVGVEASCASGWMRGPCALDAVETDSFTVSGLFERARQAVAADYGWQRVLDLHSTFGIPTYILFDEELTNDEEWEVTVLSFAILTTAG